MSLLSRYVSILTGYFRLLLVTSRCSGYLLVPRFSMNECIYIIHFVLWFVGGSELLYWFLAKGCGLD